MHGPPQNPLCLDMDARRVWHLVDRTGSLLRRSATTSAAAHKWMTPALRSLGKGRRAFCSWDEDSVTMAVEAARDALPMHKVAMIDRLSFASTTMPFADLQNAVIIAGALGLRHDIHTLDIG